MGGPKEQRAMKLEKYLNSMRGYDSDDMLNLMGLRRQSGGDWVMPMLAGLGAGMAIGAGIALMMTPYKGEEVREKVRKGASEAQRMLNEQVSALSTKVSALSEKVGMTTSGDSMTTGGVGASRPIGVGGAGVSGGSAGIGSSGGNRGY
jgi:hypothetical protein